MRKNVMLSLYDMHYLEAIMLQEQEKVTLVGGISSLVQLKRYVESVPLLSP